MRLLALSIRGFRGVEQTDVLFGHHDVLVGPNGAGKSTIIDALSLVFGRTRLVRDLTEHDFYGSCPEATSRIRIVATVAGFDGDDPELNDTWFREGRAVPKWWNSSTGEVEPEFGEHAPILCAQIAFAARFDLEELQIESIRYFHDDDKIEDPFLRRFCSALSRQTLRRYRLLRPAGPSHLGSNRFLRLGLVPKRRLQPWVVSPPRPSWKSATVFVRLIHHSRKRPGLAPLVDRINGQVDGSCCRKRPDFS